MGYTSLEYVSTCHKRGGKPEGEIWGINFVGSIFKCDKIFSIHDPYWEQEKWPEHWGHMVKEWADTPVIMCRTHPDLPTSMEYPLAEVIEEFQDAYLRNSVAYILAYALLCKPKYISMYGCDFTPYGLKPHQAMPQQYEYGRCCVEYWMGRAKERGVEIAVTQNGTLLDAQQRLHDRETAFYGYDNCQPKLEADGKKLKLVGFNEPPPKLEVVEESIRDAG